MEIVSIIICSVSLVICSIILISDFTKSKSKGISNDDINRIKTSINESLNLLSESISSLVAIKNSLVLNEVNKNNEEMKNKILQLENEEKDFMVEFQKEIVEIKKEFNEFKLSFNTKYNEQKEDIVNKINLSLKEMDTSLKEKLNDFKDMTNESLKNMNVSLKDNFKEIRDENKEKLNEINNSVNEKLEKTLAESLNTSFKSVIDGISYVNQAVGEIKGIASDVGSLKSILTNVKTKGIMGEVILKNIISDFLTSNQYVENFATKKNSNDKVEFAIKLPGSKDEPIYLPVDSKFSYNSYSIIQQSNDAEEIKAARKKLRTDLLAYADDVASKYIDVPNTTDFAIIFIPLEGLYLELLNMGLFEEIQSKYKVNLTGPTTFTAFITSLNVGFKSLTIQKKSSEVFKLLGAVKTEFAKFSTTLNDTQKKVNEASEKLDTLVGVRTRMINSKLKNIAALDEESTDDYFKEIE